MDLHWTIGWVMKFIISIIYVWVIFITLAVTVSSQQAPDPALIQKVAGQLERQRNEAQTQVVVCSANLVTLQEEIEKLKKQLEAKKDDK